MFRDALYLSSLWEKYRQVADNHVERVDVLNLDVQKKRN